MIIRYILAVILIVCSVAGILFLLFDLLLDAPAVYGALDRLAKHKNSLGWYPQVFILIVMIFCGIIWPFFIGIRQLRRLVGAEMNISAGLTEAENTDDVFLISFWVMFGALMFGFALNTPRARFVGSLIVGNCASVWLLYFLDRRLERQQKNEEQRLAEQRQKEAEQQRIDEERRKQEEQQRRGNEREQQERFRQERLEQQRLAEEHYRQYQAEQERQRKEREERQAREQWQRYHESKTMADIVQMSGLEFEQFLARLLSKMGYLQISLTPVTNDQGGDLLCEMEGGIRVVVQAKRWKGTVGNAVVGEILSAMLHYSCQRGMIITNSSFTPSAKELARKDSRITLCDGHWLEEQIRKYLPSDLPEFTWEAYNQVDWKSYNRLQYPSANIGWRPRRPTYRRRRW